MKISDWQTFDNSEGGRIVKDTEHNQIKIIRPDKYNNGSSVL